MMVGFGACGVELPGLVHPCLATVAPRGDPHSGHCGERGQILPHCHTVSRQAHPMAVSPWVMGEVG